MTKRLPSSSIFPSKGIGEVQYLNTINTVVSNRLNEVQVTKSDIDLITGNATNSNGETILRISEFVSLSISKINPTARMLLSTLILKCTNDGLKSSTVKLRLDAYMELRGLKSKKDSREQVKKDLELLYKFNLSHQDRRTNFKKNKWNQNFSDARLCDEKGIINGVIYLNFGKTFFEHLVKGFPMPINISLFKANPKTHAYSLGFRFTTHHNMNYHKKNADIIAVKTLLQACPDLPKKEEAFPDLSKRIITPFEKSLDNLVADNILFCWDYCNSLGTPLTDTQLNKFSYDIFISLFIRFQITEYPVRLAPSKKNRRKQQKQK